LQRAIALRSLDLASLQSRTSIARVRNHSIPTSQLRLYSATVPRRQQAFHSQLESTPDVLQNVVAPTNPQTVTEKIFQRYAVGLAPGKTVKAGDFLSIVTSATASIHLYTSAKTVLERSPSDVP
jgi:homoaconitate hydratase